MAEYVTLVTRGGTPVRVANAFGVPYPTSGSGSLVFSDSATFTNCTFVNPTFVDPTYEGDYTFAGNLTVGSINDVIVTSPATTATLTLANNSTFQTIGAYTLALTAVGNTSVTLPTSGTLAVVSSVTSKTANYQILAADSPTDFDNNGAAGNITLTLPAASVGLTYGFAVMEAFNLVIRAPGGVTIYAGAGSASTAGGTLTSSDVGSYVLLKCRSSTEWIAQQLVPSWTPA